MKEYNAAHEPSNIYRKFRRRRSGNFSFSWAADSRKLDRIGMQLYTVRDLMKTDFEGTLAKVAAIGYNEVEFAGYFDHKPQDVRAMLDKLHLTSPSEHVSYEVVQNKWPETLDAAHIVGHKFIVCPSIDDSQRKVTAAWKKAAEVFNRAGEASQKAGNPVRVPQSHLGIRTVAGQRRKIRLRHFAG